jgi:cyanate permease
LRSAEQRELLYTAVTDIGIATHIPMFAFDSSQSFDEMLNSDEMTRLNIVSLLAQAGYALKNGNKQRAALLFGTAMMASRYKRASYAIRGALTVNDLRKKFT